MFVFFSFFCYNFQKHTVLLGQFHGKVGENYQCSKTPPPHIIIVYVQEREAANYWFACPVFVPYRLNVKSSFHIELCACSTAGEADPVNEGHKHGTWRYSSTYLAFFTKMKLSGQYPG
jgi:hypothetical protein